MGLFHFQAECLWLLFPLLLQLPSRFHRGFHRIALYRLQNFFSNGLIHPESRETNAPIIHLIDNSTTVVSNPSLSPAVADMQHSSAPAASQYASQQGTPSATSLRFHA